MPTGCCGAKVPAMKPTPKHAPRKTAKKVEAKKGQQSKASIAATKIATRKAVAAAKKQTNPFAKGCPAGGC